MILEAVIHEAFRLCSGKTERVSMISMITILSKKAQDEDNELIGLIKKYINYIILIKGNMGPA